MAGLLGIWMLVTVLNVTKAVHIDDTAYLETAQAMTKDFWGVMQARVNWSGTAEPIHLLNQPHFFIYFLATSLLLFGINEIGFHFAMALFSGLAIAFFYRLATRFAPGHALLLTVLFVVSPAFIPAQNLMCDVPMVALWLVFFWALLCPGRFSLDTRYLIAALAAACAILTKYTSLILLPILFLDIASRRQWSALRFFLIPIGVLTAWSYWNYQSYGGVHLLGRPTNKVTFHLLLGNAKSLLLCLGAVSPIALATLPSRKTSKAGLAIWTIGLLGSALWFASGYAKGQTPLINLLLKAVFSVLGSVLLLHSTLWLKRHWQNATDDDTHREVLVLGAWISLELLFILLLSPFVAVRHLLPMIPAILLLFGRYILPSARRSLIWGGTAASVALALLLSISDWIYADVYRRAAPTLRAAIPAHARVLSFGHWGFQWYAARQGFEQYDTQKCRWQTGDYVVMPLIISSQSLTPARKQMLVPRHTIIIPSGPLTVFRTVDFQLRGGYYYMSHESNTLPWTLSNDPLEVFQILKIGPPARRTEVSTQKTAGPNSETPNVG